MSLKCPHCKIALIEMNSSEINKKLIKEREKWRSLCIEMGETNRKGSNLIDNLQNKIKELEKGLDEVIDLS